MDRLVVHLFSALVYIVNFLLAKHYPELFGMVKPLAGGGMHDNPKWYLLQAQEQLKAAALLLDPPPGSSGPPQNLQR